MDTTLQDLIKRMGVDPGFFGEGGSKLFGESIGLAGKGLEGFQKFADISKFDPAAIEEMLKESSIYSLLIILIGCLFLFILKNLINSLSNAS